MHYSFESPAEKCDNSHGGLEDLIMFAGFAEKPVE